MNRYDYNEIARVWSVAFFYLCMGVLALCAGYWLVTR